MIFDFGLKKTYRSEDRVKAFLDFIKTNNITVIFDVRWNRMNYYNQWKLNGTNLEQLIQDNFNGTHKYIHHAILGIPTIIRNQFKNQPEKAKAWYREKLEGLEAEKLFEPYKDKNIVLLCVENLKNPQTPYCHRIWLKEYLEEKMFG